MPPNNQPQTTSQLRLQNAITHYEAFNNHHLLNFTGHLPDHDLDRLAGRNAHDALEHLLKALISANYHRYPHTRDLNKLLSAAYNSDPIFALNFPHSHTLSQLLNSLNQYAGPRSYSAPLNPITDIRNYRQTFNDAFDDIHLHIKNLPP